MTVTILLLDVDGVLIHAQGYRASICASFEYITRRMGQPHLIAPTENDMLAFEAENIIFEWDSAPLCVAVLLNQVPHLLEETFNESLSRIATSGIKLDQPDFAALARQIPKPERDDIKPSRAALGTLFPEHPVFVELLGDAHTPDAPMTQIFQHFVLGDEQYARTYQRSPFFDTPSMLEKHDSPALTPENRDRLLNTPDLYPVIYTARPSLPPGFVMNWRNYSPEAEIAQRLTGLAGIPLIGYGRLQWLAAQQGVPTNAYVKPSPMQSLVSVYSAILQRMNIPDWEKRALELAISDDPLPAEILTAPWRVIVFEDSYGSIQGVRATVEKLQQQHEVSFTSVGIANDPVKGAALAKVADHVVPDVSAALQWVFNWSQP